MAASPSTRAPTERLSRERIIEAAIDLVAQEGIDGLSMRRLAARCGVGAMTLYGYVRTKEELLAALADRFFGELELPESEQLSWQEEVVAVFRAVRRLFLTHPELVPIVATQRMDGIAAYRGAELVLGALRRAGLADQQVVGAFDALTSLTIGSVRRQAGLHSVGGAGLLGIRLLPPGEFENVIDLAGELLTRDPERDFELGLQLLIRGIQDEGAQRT